MSADAYAEARTQLARQERLLSTIERFFAEQERHTGASWSDSTFSVRLAKSSTFMAQLRAGRFISPEVCAVAEAGMARERAKWSKPKRKRA